MKKNKIMSIIQILVIGMTLSLNTGPVFAAENVYNTLQLLPLEDVKPRVSSQSNGRPRLGIAFGGGGVRGFMHLGVLKALDEAGIQPDLVTGSSVGSVAAALYGSGLSIAEIEKIVREVDEFDLADPVIDLAGGLKGKAIANWVNEILDDKRLEQMRVPVGITVSDLSAHRSFLVVSGNTGEIVQTSSTIPGVFVPVENEGHILVDGALLAVVPVRYARAMGADVVIGVDIFCHNAGPPKLLVIPILMATFRMQSCALGAREMTEADILLQPDFEPNFAGSFSGRDAAIKAGYDATVARLPDILKRLEMWRP